MRRRFWGILPTPEKSTTLFLLRPVWRRTPKRILRLDMTAQVYIQLMDVKMLIIPPRRAWRTGGGNRYKVALLRNGEKREREVIIGEQKRYRRGSGLKVWKRAMR